MPPLPSSPKILIAAFAALSVLFALAGAATISGSNPTYFSNFGHELLQALTGAALTISLGGGAIEWWRRKKAKQLTRSAAFHVLDQAAHELGLIASLSASITDTSYDQDLRQLFSVPWSTVNSEELDSILKKLKSTNASFFLELAEQADFRTARSGGRVDRATDVAAELRERLDRLRSCLTELEFHDPTSSLERYEVTWRIANDIQKLEHNAVRVRALPGVGDVLLDFEALELIENCRALLNFLQASYERLKPLVEEGTDLQKAIAEREAEAAEDDRHASELLKADQEMERLDREIHGTLDSMWANLRDMQRLLDANENRDQDKDGERATSPEE